MSIDNFETENNDTLSVADVVPLGSEFKSRLAASSDTDAFKITTPSSGTVVIKFDSPVEYSAYSSRTYFQLALYDAGGNLHSYKDVASDATVTPI